MKNLIQNSFWFVILLFVACSSGTTEKVEIKNEDGKVVEIFKITSKDGKRNGLTQKFDGETGSLIVEESFKDDVLHGKQTFFFDNGQPKEVGNFENGILVGDVLTYNESGTLTLKSPYIKKDSISVLEGLLEKYYSNGQLQEKVTYVNNEENGPFEEYHENGQLAAKGNYRLDRFGDAAEVGIVEIYDSVGTLIRKLDCTFDEENQLSRCQTIFKKE